MAGGKIRAVGGSEELKARFGDGYKLTITTIPEEKGSIQKYGP